jgi:SAM-dependent methyltransferase
MPTDWSYPGRELESMAFALNYHRWILDIFKPYLGKRIVEVGAGSGSFSELLLETQPEWLIAIEPSSNMFPLLRDHVSQVDTRRVVHPLQGTLSQNMEAVLSRGEADSILYVNVLEHIEDDSAELHIMHSLLSRGGHALIFVPANRWLMGSMDRELGHHRRYERQELRSKCESAGFSIRFDSHFDVFGVVPWWVKYCLLRSRTMEPAAVRFYDRVVVPWSRRLESRFTPPVGKNLVLVAEKN